MLDGDSQPSSATQQQASQPQDTRPEGSEAKQEQGRQKTRSTEVQTATQGSASVTGLADVSACSISAPQARIHPLLKAETAMWCSAGSSRCLALAKSQEQFKLLQQTLRTLQIQHQQLCSSTLAARAQLAACAPGPSASYLGR